MEHKLDDAEKERNARGPDRIFVGNKHPLYKFLVEIYASDGVTGKIFHYILCKFLIESLSKKFLFGSVYLNFFKMKVEYQ